MGGGLAPRSEDFIRPSVLSQDSCRQSESASPRHDYPLSRKPVEKHGLGDPADAD